MYDMQQQNITQGTLVQWQQNVSCRKCKLRCPLREFNISLNKDTTCTIPEARFKAVVYHMPIVTQESVEAMSYDTVVKLRDVCTEPRDLKILHDVLMNHKEAFFPTIQRQVNINVDVATTSDEVLKRVFGTTVSAQQDTKKVIIDIDNKQDIEIEDEFKEEDTKET